MGSWRHFIMHLAVFFICSSWVVVATSEEEPESSIYQVLKAHGLPMGLLPKGVKNYSVEDSGKFEVYLDEPCNCNANFESKLHYDVNVTGNLRYGQMDGLSGISVQDLFLWFPVIKIRVDIPSSGLIYFDVGVVSKQFSLSSFETPKDCLAAPAPNLQEERQITNTISKIRPGKLQYRFDENDAARPAL